MSVTAEISGSANVRKAEEVSRDFRSDTLTIPTDAQILASLTASRGDSAYGEDEATTQLEHRLAKMAGKEAALFCVSGVMANQVAIRAHLTQPPHSVVMDSRSHIFRQESGGMSLFSQAMPIPIIPRNGHHLQASEIENALVRECNVHGPTTRLVCLENTLGGTVFPQDEMIAIGRMAKEHRLSVHLDGARIWEVVAMTLQRRHLGFDSEQNRTQVLSSLLDPVDSASLCLSKGLGAPIGTMLVGTRDFINKAGRIRKAFGGAVRQSGTLAIMADHALTNHLSRLPSAHLLGRRLAAGLEELGCVITVPVETNMVFFDMQPTGVALATLSEKLAASNPPIRVNKSRLVVHHQTSQEAVDELLRCLEALVRERRRKPRSSADFAPMEKTVNGVQRVINGDALSSFTY